MGHIEDFKDIMRGQQRISLSRKNQIEKVTRTIDVLAEPPLFKDPYLTCQPKAITEFESTKQNLKYMMRMP